MRSKLAISNLPVISEYEYESYFKFVRHFVLKFHFSIFFVTTVLFLSFGAMFLQSFFTEKQKANIFVPVIVAIKKSVK